MEHRKHVPRAHWGSPALSEGGWLSFWGSTSRWDATSGVLSAQPLSSVGRGPLLPRVTASSWEMSFETLALRGEAGSGRDSLLDSTPSERGPGEERTRCAGDTRAPSPQGAEAIQLAGDQALPTPSRPGFSCFLSLSTPPASRCSVRGLWCFLDYLSDVLSADRAGEGAFQSRRGRRTGEWMRELPLPNTGKSQHYLLGRPRGLNDRGASGPASQARGWACVQGAPVLAQIKAPSCLEILTKLNEELRFCMSPRAPQIMSPAQAPQLARTPQRAPHSAALTVPDSPLPPKNENLLGVTLLRTGSCLSPE